MIRPIAAILTIGTLCLSCRSAPPERAAPVAPDSEGFVGVLRVEGVREVVLLVDAEGRIDGALGGHSVKEIPGCSREEGREGREVGEDFDIGEYVMFSLSAARYGEYSLWLSPDHPAGVTISAHQFGPDSLRTRPCGVMGDVVEVGKGEWHRATVRVGPRGPAGECEIAVGDVVRALLPTTIARRFTDTR